MERNGTTLPFLQLLTRMNTVINRYCPQSMISFLVILATVIFLKRRLLHVDINEYFALVSFRMYRTSALRTFVSIAGTDLSKDDISHSALQQDVVSFFFFRYMFVTSMYVGTSCRRCWYLIICFYILILYKEIAWSVSRSFCKVGVMAYLGRI
jgi:hypothetical protein